jgi:hypothetical protein
LSLKLIHAVKVGCVFGAAQNARRGGRVRPSQSVNRGLCAGSFAGRAAPPYLRALDFQFVELFGAEVAQEEG